MADDVVRINTGVEMSSIAGSSQSDIIKIPRAEWDALTSAEREQRLESIAQDTLANEVSAWAYVEDGQDDVPR